MFYNNKMSKSFDIPQKFNVRKHRFPQKEKNIDIPDGDPVKGEFFYMKSCSGCNTPLI